MQEGYMNFFSKSVFFQLHIKCMLIHDFLTEKKSIPQMFTVALHGLKNVKGAIHICQDKMFYEIIGHCVRKGTSSLLMNHKESLRFCMSPCFHVGRRSVTLDLLQALWLDTYKFESPFCYLVDGLHKQLFPHLETGNEAVKKNQVTKRIQSKGIGIFYQKNPQSCPRHLKKLCT